MKEKEKIKKIEDIKLEKYLEGETFIKTNILPLDLCLGGGIVKGEFVQLVGQYNVETTIITLQIASRLCEQGKKVLYVDTKGDISLNRLKKTNLDKQLNANFFYARESEFNKVESILDEFILTNQIDLIIIDSIASLTNDGYSNIDNDSSKAKQIKINNKSSISGTLPLTLFIKKYKALSMSKHIAFLLINEYRNNVSMITGTIEKVFGPKALFYNSNVILKLNLAGKVKSSDLNEISLKLFVDKSNRVKRGTEVPLTIDIEKGFSFSKTVTNILIEAGIIKKSGAYYELASLNIKELGKSKLNEKIEENIIVVVKAYKDNIDKYYNSFKEKL